MRFGASVVACLAIYLVLAVPGRWYSSAPDVAYGPNQLVMSRGAGTLAGNELVVTHPADDGNTVISANTDFRSADYPVIEWVATGIPADAKVALLWRTDFEPSRVNTLALDVESGRLLPLDMHADPHWIGRIAGLALAVHGPFAQPLRVRGVVAKPADALGTLRDRAREWFAPETWSGASINTVAGGADVQRLPLPLLLACAIAVAIAASLFTARGHLRAAIPAIATAGIAMALVAWFALDARWLVDMSRHADAAAHRYAGKDARDKHLAADDGQLFAFIEKVRGILPKDHARIFVVADDDFFRGRAAYHLYPHNVWFEPYHNVVPPAGRLHAGDWLVVYQRRGVQYDANRHRLRWDGGVSVPVELKLLDHGDALFVVQ